MTSTLERDRLVERLEKTRTTINRGIVLLALIPLVIILSVGLMVALETFGGLIIGVLYTLGGGLAGVSMIVAGAVEHRNIRKQLRAIDELHQLPAARVVRS